MATVASILPVRQVAQEDEKQASWPALAAQVLLLAVPLVLVGAFLPAPVALLVTTVVVGPVVWRAPVRGVYFLVAAVVIVENFPLGYPDSLTDRIPLFANLSNVGVPGVSMSPLEVLMVEVAIIAYLRRKAVEGEASLPRGPLTRAYVAFMAVVLFTEVHGLFTGGQFKLSLWELRPQGYGFVMFLLAGSLVRNRRQVLVLGIVVMTATFFKAVLGVYRWQFTLQHSYTQTLLGHEDSYFLTLFLVSVPLLLVWARRRQVLLPLAMATPVVTICLLANNRRAGIFALAAALVVVAVMLLKSEAAIRKQVAVLLVIASAGVGVFIAANWNKQNGTSAQLVRPVRSLIDPNSISARDNSSDLYRVAEDFDLKFTFKQNPLVGLGFGMPFYTVASIADISQSYPLWNVIPHNTLLWVPMRMGIPGMVTFWGLIGVAILEAFAILRRSLDPASRATAIFAVAAVVAELMVAYGDLQLESYRNLVFLGALLGVLARMMTFPEANAGQATLTSGTEPFRTHDVDPALGVPGVAARSLR